jgi:Icc-related predicted phosphoesterase
LNINIVAISDIHDNYNNFPADKLPNGDVLIIAGDLTNLGRNNAKYMKRCIRWIESLTTKYEYILWIQGNHDLRIADDWLSQFKNVHNIRKKSITINGFTFYGESETNCFNKPQLCKTWDFMSASANDDADNWDKLAYFDVIVSHGPPFGVRDKIYNDTHIGSPMLREYIIRAKPVTVICGHIHEAVGNEYLGNTLVCNTAQKVSEIYLDKSVMYVGKG